MSNQTYITSEFGSLVGRTIKKVLAMNDHEIEAMGWHKNGSSVPFVIVLDDDTLVVPMSDAEGNSAGHLYVIPADEK